jgi:hypothetical protein
MLAAIRSAAPKCFNARAEVGARCVDRCGVWLPFRRRTVTPRYLRAYRARSGISGRRRGARVGADRGKSTRRSTHTPRIAPRASADPEREAGLRPPRRSQHCAPIEKRAKIDSPQFPLEILIRLLQGRPSRRPVECLALVLSARIMERSASILLGDPRRFSNQVRHRLCPDLPWERDTATSAVRGDAAFAA